jgi:hypothetical protein
LSASSGVSEECGERLGQLDQELGFEQLKGRHRQIRDSSPPTVALRIHRALSWLQRAEKEVDDHDAAFIFLWISFNAAYAEEIPSDVGMSERSNFSTYFSKLLSVDLGNKVYNAIWKRFSRSVRVLLDNHFVFQPFWAHYNGIAGQEDWNEKFEKGKKRIGRALSTMDTALVLNALFDRLYVLRNQIVHGGATWNSSVNREQVRDGAEVLRFLVPIFIELMIDNPNVAWGPPYYPVVDKND